MTSGVCTRSVYRRTTHATCALDVSDLVITLGYDMVEYHPSLWNADVPHHIVHIDFIPAEIDDHYQVEVEVVGDLAHTLWMAERAGRRVWRRQPRLRP